MPNQYCKNFHLDQIPDNTFYKNNNIIEVNVETIIEVNIETINSYVT
jgi:hypothetical protein